MIPVNVTMLSAYQSRIEIQRKTFTDDNFGPTNVEWTTVDTRWAILRPYPGATAGRGHEMDVRFTSHKRKRLETHQITFREQITLALGSHRFVDTKNGKVYMPHLAAITLGDGPYTSIPVIYSPEEDSSGTGES